MAAVGSSLDIAGARITRKFFSAHEDGTAGEIKKALIGRAEELEVVDYVYVVDKEDVLHGVVSLKEILQAPDSTPAKSIMRRHPIAADYHADQERIVYLTMKYKLKAIPVVDKQRRLVGVVPYDAILAIFHHEFREDILKSGGIHHHIKEIEEVTTPASRLVRARLPSLILGLLGGLLAAYIVTGFEQVLGSYLSLAAFIPVMVYLSDAVGTQSQTLIVRMIALEPDFSARKYLAREIKIGSLLGIIFAAALFAFAAVGMGAVQIGLIIGASMLVSIIFQSFIATYLSTLLSRFRIDPAVTSGPLTTIISDITSLTLYFTIASLLLRLA